MTLVGKHLAAGDRAPLFEVIDQNLQPVSLTQYKDKTVVISVFPSVDTSVCALQNIRFNREATKLDGDVAILSLSVASVIVSITTAIGPDGVVREFLFPDPVQAIEKPAIRKIKHKYFISWSF